MNILGFLTDSDSDTDGCTWGFRGLVQHANIVQMVDCYLAPNVLDPAKMDLYLVQGYAGTDLHHYIRQNQVRGVTLDSASPPYSLHWLMCGPSASAL